MYGALFGAGGLPDGFNTAGIQAFARNALIHAVGLGADDKAINPLSALVVLPLALFVALALPNVQYIMGKSFPGLASPGYPDQAVPALIRRLDVTPWQANLGWSLVVGILAALSLLKLNDVTEFIYFQF
jgi:hypothetical protein